MNALVAACKPALLHLLPCDPVVLLLLMLPPLLSLMLTTRTGAVPHPATLAVPVKDPNHAGCCCT